MNKRNRYDNAFKVKAVKPVPDIGQSKTWRELNLPENTLYGWLRSYRNGKLELGSGMSPQTCSLTKDDKPKEVCKRNNAGYWNNRRISTVNGALPPMVKKEKYYASVAEVA